MNVVDGAPALGLTWARTPYAAAAPAVTNVNTIAAVAISRVTLSPYPDSLEVKRMPGSRGTPGHRVDQLPQFGLSMAPLATVPKNRAVGVPYWFAPPNELAPLVTCPNSHLQLPETSPCEKKG